jgi:hypothetical protein
LADGAHCRMRLDDSLEGYGQLEAYPRCGEFSTVLSTRLASKVGPKSGSTGRGPRRHFRVINVLYTVARAGEPRRYAPSHPVA